MELYIGGIHKGCPAYPGEEGLGKPDTFCYFLRNSITKPGEGGLKIPIFYSLDFTLYVELFIYNSMGGEDKLFCNVRTLSTSRLRILVAHTLNVTLFSS